MDDLRAVVIEWRDARQEMFDLPADQRPPPEMWTRLGHAEHRLMEQTRDLETGEGIKPS